MTSRFLPPDSYNEPQGEPTRARTDHLDSICKNCIKRPQRNRYLKMTYGISLDEYEAMFKKQKGLCYLCHQPETLILSKGKIAPLAVDHDHRTGKPRSLLCNRCNLSVGGLDYLRKHKLLRLAIRYVKGLRIQHNER